LKHGSGKCKTLRNGGRCHWQRRSPFQSHVGASFTDLWTTRWCDRASLWSRSGHAEPRTEAKQWSRQPIYRVANLLQPMRSPSPPKFSTYPPLCLATTSYGRSGRPWASPKPINSTPQAVGLQASALVPRSPSAPTGPCLKAAAMMARLMAGFTPMPVSCDRNSDGKQETSAICHFSGSQVRSGLLGAASCPEDRILSCCNVGFNGYSVSCEISRPVRIEAGRWLPELYETADGPTEPARGGVLFSCADPSG